MSVEAPAVASPDAQPLRILFSMRNFWYVKLYTSVIRALAARGHQVHILAERGKHNEVSLDWNDAAEALSREHPNVTFSWAPRRIDDDWVDLRILTRVIRLGLDYLRFLEPEYADAGMLAARARVRTPEAIVSLADRPFWRTRPGRRLMAFALRTAERAMPIDAEVADCVKAQHPDVVLITPLLTLGSEQIDVLRTGRRLGIPTALCVGSWDHLSSKALIREPPHRVFVWNQTQKREAVELHGIPAGDVAVTGAQCFDEWFDRPPTLDRDAFCRKVGLDPTRPYILYVCSALFEGSPSEAEFAVRWLHRVRAGHPALRDAGVLLRPHPKRGSEWDAVDLSRFDNVAVWPPRGAAPFDEATKADYFDSMFHSATVVGLNTSALLEAGIVGRAVHTILLPEFRDNQEGTLHFRYLLDLGLLRAARDLDTHVEQLHDAVRDANPSVHHNRAFVEAFIRPNGLQAPSTPVFVREVEELPRLRPRPYRDPFWVPLLRYALTPLARSTSGTYAEQVARTRRRRDENAQRWEEKMQRRRDRLARRETLARQRREQQLADERERKERVLLERETKRLARQQLAEQTARRKHEEELEKQRQRDKNAQEKDERLREWRRKKQRAAFRTRLAAYYRRIIGAVTLHR